jgi:phospholipase C
MDDRMRRDAEERFAAEHPELALSRRELLQRSAYAAGLAGLSALPLGTLMQQASKAQAQASTGELEHVVIVMMENRSFDHYFGWLGATGLADGSQSQTYNDPSGNAHSTQHASSMGTAEWQGCGHPDPGHGWESGRAQLNGGFLADGSGNDDFALTYYNDGDLGFIHETAKNYTVYDRFFCSQLGPTWPNRYYKWSGQSGGRSNNDPPVATGGNQWESIFDVALRSGGTARYYNSDLPFSAVWGPRGVPWTRPLAEYYADAALGQLANVTIVDPPFRDGGGFDGNSADEHPHGDVRLGQAWMADVVKAFVESPHYAKGALFVVYDEWGGFYDHVTPPSVADNRQTTDLNTDFGQMGFRIPAVTISPWTRNQTANAVRANSGQYGFESILKFVLDEFGWSFNPTAPGAAPLRVTAANSIGDSFDWANPDYDPPDLPEPEHIVSRPCAMGGGDVLEEGSAAAHESDLAAMADVAEQFGFAVGESKPSDLFRKPDSVRRALAGS